MMALRLAAPSVLVDLGAIDELRQIELGEFGVRIGAMVMASRWHVPIWQRCLAGFRFAA